MRSVLLRLCFMAIKRGWVERSSGGALDRAQGTCARHRARAPAQGDGARLRHLLDAQWREDGEQCLELVGRTGRLEGDGVRVDVDDPGPEELARLQHLGALGNGRAHLHKEQLALDGRSAVQLDNLYDLDEL